MKKTIAIVGICLGLSLAGGGVAAATEMNPVEIAPGECYTNPATGAHAPGPAATCANCKANGKWARQ